MKELRKKSDEDLQKMLRDKKHALQNFRFDISGANVKNVREVQNLRKGIARIMTELTARKFTTSKQKA